MPKSREALKGCIQGAYTLRVGNLLTSTELEKLTAGVLAKLRPLSRVQREIVISEILKSDDRARRHAARGWTPSTTLAAAVRRDGVM